MNLVVDTSVWSLVLRRTRVDEQDIFVQAFRKHVDSGDAIFLMGNILQELLDGLKTKSDFDRMVRRLKPFPVLTLRRRTYVEAARLRQLCRSKGIQAGPVDFLISAACIENGFPLLTADRDFFYIAKNSELLLLPRLKDAR